MTRALFKYILVVPIIIVIAIQSYAFDFPFSSQSTPPKTIQIKKTATVKVLDSETKEPIFGALAELAYKRELVRDKYKLECRGENENTTKRNGVVDIEVTADNCPQRFDQENMSVMVKCNGYATYHQVIKGTKIEIYLAKTGFTKLNLPLKAEYPGYLIDINVYSKNFTEISNFNKSKSGGQLANNYLVRKYSSREAFGEGFDDFFEKIENSSSISSIPLLSSIIQKAYSLPPDNRTANDAETRRQLKDYVYIKGLQYASNALYSIADEQAVKLLPQAVDFHAHYLDVLREANITLSTQDYWDYKEGKYVAKYTLVPTEKPRLDELTLVRIKLKEKFSGAEYIGWLVKLLENPKHAIDKERLLHELVELKSPAFSDAAKHILSNLEAGKMARMVMRYLYEQKEYEYLAKTIKNNSSLMTAFLALDARTYSITDTGDRLYADKEECLIEALPQVTKKLKAEIDSFLRTESKNYSYYDWWIRNAAHIDAAKANKLLLELYSNTSKPNRYEYRLEMETILRGATDGKLSSICLSVLKDIDYSPPKDELYNYLFSARLTYLNAACPNEMKHFAASFTSTATKNYDIDMANPLWTGVIKNLPKEVATRQICQNKLKLDNASLAGVKPMDCVCEAADKYIQARKDVGSWGMNYVDNGVIKYLTRCYPNKAEYYLSRMPFEIRELSDRSFQGFVIATKQRNKQVSLQDFFTGHTFQYEHLNKMISWTQSLNSHQAFAILDQALASDQEDIKRMALYSYSFYPKNISTAILKILTQNASGNNYPSNLYSAYSLAVAKQQEAVAKVICASMTQHHAGILENREYTKRKDDFEFNTVTNLALCGLVGDEANYRTLLHLILQPEMAWRFSENQGYLEKYIFEIPINIDSIINQEITSNKPTDIIIGLRLAELKHTIIDAGRLRVLLNADDAYVRLATAKYIVKNKIQYMELYEDLKKNSNRRVRALTAIATGN